MRLARIETILHRPGGHVFKVWRKFPAIFAVFVSAGVCLGVIAFVDQTQPEVSVLYFAVAAFAALAVFGGIFFFHFWKNCQRSEWAIYMDSSGIFINPHPSFGHPPIEDDVYVIHLEFPDIASARRINDTKNLYPGSFRWLEKSRITYLELTINDKVSAALAGLLRHISTGPRSEELIIMPVLFDGKTLVVYWRNEDFSIHPTCNRALDVLREFGVAIPNDPASLDRNRSGGIAEQSRRTML